ncbi:MAG: hypothetical protein DWH91_10405 [Planctomycetota bacterium]|nr:MAG: hypothetical protein DWH91_10405 [Planctomycetota bacterium]
MTAPTENSLSTARRYQRWIAWIVFGLALVIRLSVFRDEPRENDEKIYRALVEQLAAGQGYTLRGHPILNEPWLIREQYDQPMFFHPPGGLAVFWGFYLLFGTAGFGLAQWALFGVFYWATLRLIRQTAGRLDHTLFTIACMTVALSPIMAHVSTHLWLDGPQTAWATLAATICVDACRRRSLSGGWLAGLIFTMACWTKLHAVLALPGIYLVSWACRRRIVWGPVLVMTMTIGVLCVPWLVWQWRVLGSPFPTWAGRPHPELIANNAYVRYLTDERKWWIYFPLLTCVMSTLPSALYMLWRQPPQGRLGKIAWALGIWIGVVVAVIAGLGAIGYSKLLRYIILVSPATACLWVLAAQDRRQAGRAIPLIAWLGLGLEWLHGFVAVILFYRSDLIVPLIWPR